MQRGLRVLHLSRVFRALHARYGQCVRSGCRGRRTVPARHIPRTRWVPRVGGTRFVHRLLATAAATTLLGLSGAALAAPAQAEVDSNLLGGVARVGMNGTVTAQILQVDLVRLDNPLRGIV
ncbi:hypothetical protein ACSNOK_21080 [Streptomyces sp. URMC 126]|uniref:hypothetical protein n=1 Tax=Streptomyces sp. URMC 126 TaxID=3423401 RepID=UPI003F19AA8F